MEEHQNPAPSDPRLSSLPGANWSDLRWLVLLLAIALGLRAWQLTHTEVTSRDSVGYIRIAWRLGHEDWRVVVPSVHQHPGYPAAILFFSAPFRHLLPDNPALAMQLAAQFACATASILLIFPVFYLGKEIFDSRVAFWATLFLQLLPSSGKLMADGLSEPLFLLLAVSGLFCACRALRTGSLTWFVGTGLASGLAYLTRFEGCLVVLAAGFVLLVGQVLRTWQISWRQCLGRAFALAGPALLVALPFMITIQGFTVKLIRQHMVHETSPRWSPPEEAALPPAVSAPTIPWAIWWIAENRGPADRYVWAVYALAVTYFRATFYILWAPALLGFFLFWDRLKGHPGGWVLLVLTSVLLVLLYRVAQVMGYMSERHIVLVVLFGLYPAVAAIAWLANRVSALVPNLRGQAILVTAVSLCLVSIAPLRQTLATLHADRSGFRQAGEWLAHHAETEDELVDPYAWANYYAGRDFVQGGEPSDPSSRTASSDRGAKITYVVLEEGPNPHGKLWWLVPQARKLAQEGKVVQSFPVKRGNHRAEVVIYRVSTAERQTGKSPAATHAGRTRGVALGFEKSISRRGLPCP